MSRWGQKVDIVSFCSHFVSRRGSVPVNQQHRDNNIATTTSRQQHRDNNITTTTSRQQHRNNNIETTTSRQQHRDNNIETTTSRQQQNHFFKINPELLPV
jgi:hypothetical protein